MKAINLFLFSFLAGIILISCEQVQHSQQQASTETLAQFTSLEAESNPSSDDFNAYWYQGAAEISSYKLEQARYGEIHQGHAVLVFVTEDMSKSKQVKLDYAEAAGADRVPVLKLNFTKKFNTGIYPYSIMQSVFTPVSLDKYPHTLKTTMSAQEWCGHVFTQLNLKKGQYQGSAYSYFESEGDATFSLKKVLLEDELWTRIRINPSMLPTGKVELIPSITYSRLKHRPLKPMMATIEMSTDGENNMYSIMYPEEKRSLKITFQAAFPHKIISWEERYRDGYGSSPELLTRGTLLESLTTDYWSKNGTKDLPMRDELRLPN